MQRRGSSFRGSLNVVVLLLGTVGLAIPAAASADGLVPITPTPPALTVPSVPAAVAVPSVPAVPTVQATVPAGSTPAVAYSAPALPAGVGETIPVATGTGTVTVGHAAGKGSKARSRKHGVRVQVRADLSTRSLAATTNCNSTQAGSALNCVNLADAGLLINTCNGNEPVVFSGTVHVETGVIFDPLTGIVLTQRVNFQNVSGTGAEPPFRRYQANDTGRTETTTSPFPLAPIDLFRSDHTELISLDSTPNFLLHETVRTHIDPLTLIPDITVSGPGIKCTNS